MKTIQAVELRKNLDSYLKRASQGEKFKVTYRGKSLAILTTDESVTSPNAPAVFAAAKAFNNSLSEETRDAFAKITDTEIQKLRKEHMKEKYGV